MGNGTSVILSLNCVACYFPHYMSDIFWRQICVLDCARGCHQAVCGSNGRLYKSVFFPACFSSKVSLKCLCLSADALRSKCRLARSQALRASARSDSFAIFIPECNSDGTYTEVQCHNQTGYCWCSSPDGMPMSGSSVLHLRPNCTGEFCLGAESTIVHDSLKTCEHERMSVLAEAAIQGSEERFVLECSADGRYRAVQCHSSTGYSSFSSVQTLHRYFVWLDADTDGLLSEREMRPLRLLRPRRCAKKLMQFCDRNVDRRLSAQELASCLVSTNGRIIIMWSKHP
uniref:Thyroglobulin type-1 domain-containing protein n=1 Tax=Sinocyclocheilus anshuiensis TaxID=1608454 RepID=A0A671PTP9_9TELE